MLDGLFQRVLLIYVQIKLYDLLNAGAAQHDRYADEGATAHCDTDEATGTYTDGKGRTYGHAIA